MINRVVLVGRLTADPELRKTNSGTSVASFTVAVDNAMKNPDGTRGTCFMNCSVFNAQADNVAKFTRKGAMVGIEGRLNQRKFTRKDGTNASVIEVVCDTVRFLESKGPNGEATTTVNADNLQDPNFDEDKGVDLYGLDTTDDDLPF